MRWRLRFQERKLDDLFISVSKIEDDEIKSYMSKLLCVRTSGFIESSLKNLINEYLCGSVPKPVEFYVNSKMKAVANLRFEKLLDTLNAFNESWKFEFLNKVTDEQKAALNSLISNRNNIAHGENDAISFEVMKRYYLNAKEVVWLLEKIIKK